MARRVPYASPTDPAPAAGAASGAPTDPSPAAPPAGGSGPPAPVRGGGREARPWRSIVFAPVGDGTTRRRGSDVIRVVIAILTVLCCWLVVGTNAGAEHSISHFVSPPPNGVAWLVTTVWVLGTFGVIAVLAFAAVLSHRAHVVRDLLVAGVGAWVLTVVLQVLWGHNGGRPPTNEFPHVDLSFPLARIAATIAVAFAALPYLSRLLQRVVECSVLAVAIAAVVHGSGTAISVLASVALGWGVVALMHLVVGSSLGLPSSAEVAVLLEGIGMDVTDLRPTRHQVWGVARFVGHDAEGRVDTSLYGRDAQDAQLFAKLGRFVFYRDSGPHLALTRLQQVEHEAYLTLMAARAGAQVPEVLAAELVGASRDAIFVSRPPAGDRLVDVVAARSPSGSESGAADAAGDPAPATPRADPPAATPGADPPAATATDGATAPAEPAPVPVPVAPEAMSDAQVRGLFDQVLALRAGGIAHGAISSESIVVGPDDRVGLVDFRCATAASTTERLDRDVAAALAATGRVVGTERTVAAATAAFSADELAAALPFLQRAALDDTAKADLRGQKAMLAQLREQGAAAAGVEVPKLAEPRRVSWVTLVLILGTVIGGWALILVLANVAKSFSVIRGANWGWVTAVFLLAQLAYPSEAVCVLGSVTDPVPFGRATALEFANAFVGLAGGTMAVLATRVRFFQQQGYSGTLAVSSGVLVSTVSWIVKGGLFLIALPFAIGSLHFKEPTTATSSSTSHLLYLCILVVAVVGVGLGVVLFVPRLRRLARDKLRPKVSEVVAQLKLLANHPRKLFEIFGGCIAAQLLVALALGASLHAFDEHLSLAVIIVVITLGSMLGGISPVPGGMGVVEAGMILGLTAAGIPEPQAVAAVFVQRMFTSYLPPIWGWFVLVGMRRREYL